MSKDKPYIVTLICLLLCFSLLICFSGCESKKKKKEAEVKEESSPVLLIFAEDGTINANDIDRCFSLCKYYLTNFNQSIVSGNIVDFSDICDNDNVNYIFTKKSEIAEGERVQASTNVTSYNDTYKLSEKQLLDDGSLYLLIHEDINYKYASSPIKNNESKDVMLHIVNKGKTFKVKNFYEYGNSVDETLRPNMEKEKFIVEDISNIADRFQNSAEQGITSNTEKEETS